MRNKIEIKNVSITVDGTSTIVNFETWQQFLESEGKPRNKYLDALLELQNNFDFVKILSIHEEIHREKDMFLDVLYTIKSKIEVRIG